MSNQSPFELVIGEVSDSIKTLKFFEGMGNEVRKPEQCEELVRALIQNLNAATVGIFKKEDDYRRLPRTR
eukprot:3315729-Pleurochrysis_carterae.AAC.1